MSVADENITAGDNINGQNAVTAEEIEIPVPWGHISGKWWGPMGQMPIIAVHGWQDNAGSFDLLIQHLPPDIAVFAIDLPGHGLSSHCKWWGPKEVQPILALHGRQDNAGTFDTLIPLLSNEISVLCLDLPGHGLSSHYPKSQFYFMYWDGVVVLRRIAKYFEWSKVKLIGHSLGGAVSFLYAATYPDEVEYVIALDIVGPTIGDITKTVSITGAAIDKFLEYDQLSPATAPTYKYEDVIRIAENAYGKALSTEGVKILMKRGTRHIKQTDRYSFTRDPRLKVSTLGLLSTDHIYAFAAQIKCGYVNIRADKGFVTDQPEVYDNTLDIIKRGAKRFEYHKVEGTHFVHLNNPERVAPIISKFIST